MKLYQSILASTCAVVALTSYAIAQSPQTYSDVERVEISDFIGTVTVKTGGRDVKLTARDGTDASYPLEFDRNGNALVVHSDEDPDDTRWWKEVNWKRDKDKAFVNFLKAYPTLTLTVPRGTELALDSAVVIFTADDTDGAFFVDHGHVDGSIGDVSMADVNIHGSGDLTMGDVAGNLEISIHGSGDFEAGSAGELDARIHGSGDIELSDIRGDASASVHGSGDIALGKVGGEIDLNTHGSGDIRAESVAGGAHLASMGSGDLFIASVNGETEASTHGSGDIRIGSGRAENLNVRVAGSGDFTMGGVATNPNVSARGSGDVDIAKHEGSVRARGRGDIRISGVNYSDRD